MLGRVLKMRNVAVLGHSNARRREGFRSFEPTLIAEVAAPEDGRTPKSKSSDFENTP